VKAPVQYGPRIRAIATYLNQQHFIPEERLSELLTDIFRCSMSPATIVKLSNTVKQSFEQGKRKKIVAKVCIGFRAIQVWLEPSFFRTCCSQ
jgi:transposase